MVNVSAYKEKMKMEKLKNGLRPFHAVLTAFILAAGTVVSAAWHHPPVWDSSVYIAMGKFLFTGGAFGFWEIYRPPVMPVLLGALWRTGLPIETFRILSVLLSAASLLAVYEVFRRMENELVALVAAGSTGASYIFIHWTINPLTAILASALVVISLYLAWRGRYLAAGATVGLAFLTRFPSAIAGPAIAAWIAFELYRNGSEITELAESWLRLGGGFLLVSVPYLAAAHLTYGSFMAPFSTGYEVTAATGTQYIYGFYYLIAAGQTSPLMFLAPIGAFFALRRMTEIDTLMLSAALMFYGFFTYFPLKIDRYVLLFLPLIGFFAGKAAQGLYDELAERKFSIPKLTWIVAALLIAVTAVNGYANYHDFNWSDPAEEEFFSHVSELEGVVASNDPRVNAYGNFVYETVPVRRLGGVWSERENYDYIAINSCSWDCRNAGEDCEDNIQEFETNLEQYETSFETSNERCEYTVRRIE